MRVEDIFEHPVGTTPRTIIEIEIELSPEPLRIAVTDDHRIRVAAAGAADLQNQVYRHSLARALKQRDILRTDMGNFPIASVRPREELAPVFAVTFSADQSVYMTMAPTSNMVAVFGAPHQTNTEQVEFRLKGVVSNRAEIGSAQAWLAQFPYQLNEFDMRFQVTSPYSVWVRSERADRFCQAVKELLPKHSRIRRQSGNGVGADALDWVTDDGFED